MIMRMIVAVSVSVIMFVFVIMSAGMTGAFTGMFFFFVWMGMAEVFVYFPYNNAVLDTVTDFLYNFCKLVCIQNTFYDQFFCCKSKYCTLYLRKLVYFCFNFWCTVCTIQIFKDKYTLWHIKCLLFKNIWTYAHIYKLIIIYLTFFVNRNRKFLKTELLIFD